MHAESQPMPLGDDLDRGRREFGRLLDGACEAASRAAVEAERARLGGEIHDCLAQAFAAVLLQARAAGNCRPRPSPELLGFLNVIESIAIVGLEDSRRCVLGLRSSLVEKHGLVRALERLVASMSTAGGTRVVFVNLAGAEHLEASVEDTAYRIAQEATQNALRHAGARLVTVTLQSDVAVLRVRVDDDGDCVPHDAIQGARERGGLRAMRQRAEDCGGCLTVQPRAPRGTRVEAVLPLDREAA